MLKGGMKGMQDVWALLCYFKLADTNYEYEYQESVSHFEYR